MLAWLLALLVLIGVAVFGFSAVDSGTHTSQSCAASTDGIERCGPETEDDAYLLPESGTVVRAVVNGGPAAPGAQKGYEITIDASGNATIVETAAQSGIFGTPEAAATTVRTVELGEDGLQGLLQSIDSCGFYGLPQAGEFAPNAVPDGGGTSSIEVDLANGTWSVLGSVLDSPVDQSTLENCQLGIATWVGAAVNGN